VARPRSFDEDAVLTAAMHAFRREGYTRIPVSRLEEVTGLRTSSLYNAYGDKAGLFERALNHYVTTLVAPRLAAYAGPTATLEELEGLFVSLLEPPLNDGFGCLVVNSALELGGDLPAASGVSASLAAVADHIDDVLRRELNDDAEAGADAAALALLYQGLLVQSRAGLLNDRHREAVQTEFARLRARREEAR
jgi:AcrR family transcriptional regulator